MNTKSSKFEPSFPLITLTGGVMLCLMMII